MQENFNIDDDTHKESVLVRAGDLHRNWRTTLTREYIKRDRSPLDDYTISEEQWEEFKRQRVLKSAIRRAQLREEEILRDADKKAERALERAEEQIQLEKKRMVNEVKDEVSKMAVEIASAVIERDVSETEHKDLIDSFIDKMG